MLPSKWASISNIGFLEDTCVPVEMETPLVDPAYHLPRELMLEVFSRLDLESLIVAGQVSKRWRVLSKMRPLWSSVDLRGDIGGFFFDLHDEDFKCTLAGADYGCENDATIAKFARRCPETRRYLRTLVAAPCLRSLTFDFYFSMMPDFFVRTILKAPISEVHTLEVIDQFHNHPETCYSKRKLLKKFSKHLEVLKIWNLTTECVPIIRRMKNLKVLHFSNHLGSTSVPLFKPRCHCERATLEELKPLRERKIGFRDKAQAVHSLDLCHVYQSTMRSLIEFHAETLQVLHLPKHPNSRMLSALEKCVRLTTLVVPLQPKLAEVCELVPSVCRLTVVLGSYKAGAKQYAVLGLLPRTVRELTLVVNRRTPRLHREFSALGQACSGLDALQHLRIVCVTSYTLNAAQLVSWVRQGLQRGDHHPLEVDVELEPRFEGFLTPSS